MTTTTKNTFDLSTLFILDDFDSDAQKSFLQEVGTLVFQSALMRYVHEHSTIEISIFEKFIESRISSETFIDELCNDYPDFKELLNDEMESFRSEVIVD